MEHTCIKDDGGTPNRVCYACRADSRVAPSNNSLSEPIMLPLSRIMFSKLPHHGQRFRLDTPDHEITLEVVSIRRK